MEWPDGEPWDFAASALTLVRWWTVRCPCCRDSLPDLEQLASDHRARGLRLLPVFHPKGPLPGDQALREYLAELGYRGPLAKDLQRTKLRDLMKRGRLERATSISFLVDRSARIRWVHPGPRVHRGNAEHPRAAADFAELQALVDDLLPLAPGRQTRLRVLGFNIRYGTAKDGANAWTRRRDLVVDTIERFDPDLLGTQEAQSFQVHYLQGELSNYARVSRSRSANPGDEQCAIFYRKSRFDPLEVGHFMLSDKPDQHGSRGWDAALPRITTWARLRDKQNGRVLLCANTHFDHRGERARLESWVVLQEELRRHARGRPIVLVGDFNQDLAGSRPAANLCVVGLGLRDAHVSAGLTEAEAGTYHGFTGRRTSARIDGVLAHGDFKVLSASIDRWRRGERYPSDHFPIRAVLQY